MLQKVALSARGMMVEKSMANGTTTHLSLDLVEQVKPAGSTGTTLRLFVECKWRLDSEADVVGGTGNHAQDIVGYANSLEGDVIEDIDLTLPSCDLTIALSSGRTLTIFCDEMEPRYDNYHLFLSDITISVIGMSGIRVSPAERAARP